MQLLLNKKTSHSEATKTLVKELPVKEREIPLQLQSNMIEKPSSVLHRTRLDLEIGVYWVLSKYQQSKRKHLTV